MLSLPRHTFANACVLPGPPGYLYLLKPKGTRSHLLELHISSRKTRSVALIPDLRLYPAMAFDTDTVYLLGGMDIDESKLYKESMHVHGKTGAVGTCPELIYARGKASAVVHNRYLYVLGGYEEIWMDGKPKFRLSITIEKLYPGLNWVLVSVKLPVPLARPSVCVFSNQLYLLGGSTSGSLPSHGIYELGLGGGETRKVGESRWVLEEGMPVLAEGNRRGIRFTGRRNATEEVVELKVEWTIWELRRYLLYSRLKLQRLGFF